MDRETFERVVRDVLGSLPDWTLASLDNLRFVVEDRPATDDSGEQEPLLGLYEGIPLHERGPDYVSELPDTIYVYREPHLALGLTADALEEEIARTVLHELAHYFGIDDDRLDEIGWG